MIPGFSQGPGTHTLAPSLRSGHYLQFIVLVWSLLSHRTLASTTIKCHPGMGKFSEALKGSSAGKRTQPELQALPLCGTGHLPFKAVRDRL